MLYLASIMVGLNVITSIKAKNQLLLWVQRYASFLFGLISVGLALLAIAYFVEKQYLFGGLSALLMCLSVFFASSKS